MNEKEKSLALAELMGWYVLGYRKDTIESPFEHKTVTLCPYEESTDGMAQFAAILLKFPEVMHRISCCEPHDFDGRDIEPTQTNILDEILRMKGYDIDKGGA